MADDAKKIIPFPQIRTALIPSAYDPEITDFALKFNGRLASDPAGPIARDGPIRAAPIPFALIGNAPAIVIASQDAYRKALFIKNLDPVANLYIGFGTLADTNGLALDPLGYILLDFVCPTDTISVFATANVRGFLMTMAPTAS